MDNEQKDIQLNPQLTDHAMALTRAILGIVPIGSVFVELLETIIPNQRIDRIAKLIEALNRKLSDLEQDFLYSQLSNENFTDLLEEGMKQAAHSLSDERREYIANLIVNGLASENIEYIESKHLLRILGEIDDIEIIWLRSYLPHRGKRDKEYTKLHENVLKPITPVFNSPPEVFEKRSLQESHVNHLVRLDLLETVYGVDLRNGLPTYEAHTGKRVIFEYRIASLGNLLLKHIGLVPDDLDPNSASS